MYYNLSQQLVARRLVAVVVWLIDCQLFWEGGHCCYCSVVGDLVELVLTRFLCGELRVDVFFHRRVFPSTCSHALLKSSIAREFTFQLLSSSSIGPYIFRWGKIYEYLKSRIKMISDISSNHCGRILKVAFELSAEKYTFCL